MADAMKGMSIDPSEDKDRRLRCLHPEPVPLKGYGNGAFRFLEVRHEGGLCILPSGIFAWPCRHFSDVVLEDFAPAFQVIERMNAPFASSAFSAVTPQGEVGMVHVDFLLFGAGEKHRPPPEWLLQACARLRIGLEVMTTGAAVRTYNVCREEERLPATFLLPVS